MKRYWLSIILILAIATSILFSFTGVAYSANGTDISGNGTEIVNGIDLSKPSDTSFAKQDLSTELPVVKRIPTVNAFGELAYENIFVTAESNGDITCSSSGYRFVIKAPDAKTNSYAKQKGVTILYESASVQYGDTWYDIDEKAYSDSIRFEIRGKSSTGTASIQLESSYVSWWDTSKKTIWFGTQQDKNNFDAVLPFSAIGFDYSDASQIADYNNYSKVLSFNVPKNTPYLIDPSVVSTATTHAGLAYSHQNKVFYANGRHWVFYSDGTDFVYKTSTDGSSWSSATTIKATLDMGIYASVYFDGTYVYYATAKNSIVYFRRGTPNADGTITWSAAEQSATAGSGNYYPTVSTDTTGRPYVTYSYLSGVTLIPYVSRSSTTDGTWSTDAGAGFPYQVSTTNCWAIDILQLSADKMYIVYKLNSGAPYTIKGREYNAGWSAEQSISSTNTGFSATSNTTDVMIAFCDTSSDIVFHERDSGGTWSGATTVQASVLVDPNISLSNATGDIVVFWADSAGTDHVYYKKRVAGAWDGSATDWVDKSVDGLQYNCSSFLQSYSNVVGLAFESKSGSPFDVNYAYLETTSTPDVTTVAASSITATTGRLNANVVDDGGESCEVRWGYGTTSQAAIAAYDTSTAFAGAYITGNNPYLDVATFTCNQTYYFRCEIQNAAGTELGDELSFTTADCGIGEPTNTSATATSSTITATWTKGGGASGTEVRYKEGCESCTTSSNTTMTLAYIGTDLTNTTISGLDAGTSYCLKFWAYDGSDWSTGNATLCITTIATESAIASIETPDQPAGWFQSPDYTGMSETFIYDAANNFADQLEMPRGSFWLLLASSISMIFALIVGLVTKKMIFAALALTIAMAVGSMQKLIPVWIPGLSLVFTILMMIMQGRHEQA